MSNRILTAVLFFAAFLFIAGPCAFAGFEGEVEGSIVAASRNDVAISGKDGTHISLVNDLKTRPAFAFRARVGYRIADRHLISVLYAPLSVTARGKVNQDITFFNEVYPANTPLLGFYRFDSYRITYRYSIVWGDGWDVAVGFTAKIRDAEIALHGVHEQRRRDTGFVPLLNLHVEWRPNNGQFGILLDVDAMVAPQGRAEDILIAGTWAFHENLELRLGYRTVEGGAANDSVYTFAWLHYAVLGIKLSL